MGIYNTIVTLHVICVGVWITNGIAGPIAGKLIKSDNGLGKNLISFLLKYTNIAGMIGAMGLLITGVVMVLMNPAYGFFVFSANHWLVTKQIIMLVILGMVFARIIPTAKNIRLALGSDLNEATMTKIWKLGKTNQIVVILVIFNLLLALSRNYM
jgi:hypothetical protein